MPTLYVENIPKSLYEAIRARARKNRTSIAVEVLGLLEQNVPTAEEIRRRKALLKAAAASRERPYADQGMFPATEEMMREDRSR
jgi:plasmid stability protein